MAVDYQEMARVNRCIASMDVTLSYQSLGRLFQNPGLSSAM